MSDNPNPAAAHKEILDVIPESLHNQVIPVLKKWDQAFQDGVAEVRSEYADYEPYKPFIENNIDPNYLQQAAMLMYEAQQDPAKVVKQMNETFELGYVHQDEVQPEGDDLNNEWDDTQDISKHPEVKKMMERLEQLDNQFQERTEEEEEAREAAELQEELKTLEAKAKENNLPYNEKYVLALMTQGVSGDEALKDYQQVISGTVQVPDKDNTDDPPPAVMGGEGTVGSGTGEEAFNVAGSKESVNSFVESLIQAQDQSGQ